MSPTLLHTNAARSRRSPVGTVRGTVILVALCFVAVLGIALASYLAVCSRAMQLSNRAFQNELSKQLAEAGLEEGLRAFNKNNWSDWTSGTTSVDWTLDTTNKRATATMTLPSSKFGQGVTAAIKLRVDNYDAAVLGSTWSNSRNYRINDLVGYNGVWYRCVSNHTNQTPSGMANLAYWAPEPIGWTWQPNVSYSLYAVVNYDHDGDGVGTWFRCTTAHTSGSTWSSTNWTSINSITLYNASAPYVNGDIIYYPNSTTWYLYSSGWQPTAGISWQYLSSTTYRFNDLVYYYNTTTSSYAWYRYINVTPTSGQVPTSTTYWENALSGGVHGWASSSIRYNLGDVVYYGTTGLWYRCILAHTSSTSITPANTTYWTGTPALSNRWSAGPYYQANDVVLFNGVWYLCIQTHTSTSAITPRNTSYWIGADTSNTSYQWNSTTSYAANAYRCYQGVWYKSLTSHTNSSPNNTTNWTPTWSQSNGSTSGAPVIYAEATVTLGDRTSTKAQLRANIDLAPLFPNAAGASTTLTVTSGTGTIDSYDSSLGTTYASQVGTSTNYSAVVSAGTESASGTSTLLSVAGTTTIKGYVAAVPSTTSPYAPRTSLGTSVVVKSSTSPVSPNVDLTRVSRSPVVPKFDARPTPLSTAFTSMNFPYGRALPTTTPSTGNTINLGSPGATTPARYYYNASFNIGTSYYCSTLNINGPAIIYVNGSLRTLAGGTIKINPSGSAIFAVDGGIRTDASTGGFANATLDPKNLVLISDLTTTTTQYLAATTNPFYGVIYAPNTTATLGVDTRTGVSIYGAINAREITFSTEATLHYDTALRYVPFAGIDQPYTVTNWSELDATEQATMP